MNSNSPPRTILQDEDELFYFESDHLALRGNKDYSEILKTIFILESQRAQAIKDYNIVVELHKQALNNPELFLQKIKNGQSVGAPDLQIIAEVPNIHWSKYKVTLPEEGLKFVSEQKSYKAQNIDFSAEENNLRYTLDTHNKQWTTEEQKRLEELLVIYPPEPIEFRRFKKIAAALGNRTVKQVSSRVQKYFLKLYKAGLPIPGRIPKYAERSKKSKLHLHQRHNHYLFKPTTFFPQLNVPVVMNESEEVPGPSTGTTSSTRFVNYLIPNSSQPIVQQTEEPKNDVDIQLNILHKVKSEKQTENDFQSSFQHFGYRCDYCNEEPIIGTRWHCQTCEAESVDFCSDCVISQMYSRNAHPLSHRLESIGYDDTVTSTNYSDSSSESISGSVFDSSNKNFGSSDEESCSSDELEQFEETQNSSESYDDANLTIKYEEEDEEEEDEDEGDVNDYNDYNLNFKTEDDYGDYKVNNGDGCSKEGEEDDLAEDDINNARDFQENDDEVADLENHDVCQIESYNQNDVKVEEDQFTDTQNISYSYLHSHLLLDNNSA